MSGAASEPGLRYLDAKNIGKLCNFLGFSLCDNKIIMKMEMIFTIE